MRKITKWGIRWYHKSTRGSYHPLLSTMILIKWRRGTKHSKSPPANSILEELSDNRHASKHIKEYFDQSSKRNPKNLNEHSFLQHQHSFQIYGSKYTNIEKQTTNWGNNLREKPNQCKSIDVSSTRKELNTTRRIINEDTSLELWRSTQCKLYE